MSARFCDQCGKQTAPQARFCSQCGSALGPGAPTASDGWRLTTAGGGVLAFFLVAGLAIWTLILSPTPPRPGPGGGAPPRPASPAATATATPPEGHPPFQMPDEVRRFIADLETKAKQQPKDVATWLRLGQVNARAAQLDPSYFDAALAGYRRVLELEPENATALQGIADVHYDRGESAEAIRFYERYLAQRPDDAAARTDLGTMYLQAGNVAQAVTIYQEVIRRNPSFVQAHYNLAITHHRQGDDAAALRELDTARRLATDDRIRGQIDEMVASIKGGASPSDGGRASARGAAASTPFQRAVEDALRGHPIMGPRIVRVEWGGAGAGRVLVRDFPMEGMPPEVRDKFKARLGETLRSAEGANPVEGPVRIEIADLATGRVMETVTP